MIIMREFMLVSSSITEDIVEVLTNADAGLQIFKRNEFWLISIFLCRLFIRLVFQPPLAACRFCLQNHIEKLRALQKLLINTFHFKGRTLEFIYRLES